MKRLLSLTLLLIMLLGLLISCTEGADECIDDLTSDTSTDIKASTNTETGTSTKTDTMVDSCPDDLMYLQPTINNFEIDSEKTTYYYEPLVLGAYTGDKVPSSDGNIRYAGPDFDFGWYYYVIKSYDELQGIVKSPENVDPSIFDTCYILLASYYDRTTSKYQVMGFRDLTFNDESKELEITADGVYSEIVGEAEWVYNLYFAIPSSSAIYKRLTDFTYGELSFKFNKTAQKASGYVYGSSGLYGVENGSTWLFNDINELENKLMELDPSLKSPDFVTDENKKEDEELLLPGENEQTKKSYVLLLTYRDRCNCINELLGYDSLRIENGIAYITLKTLDSHNEECTQSEPRLWASYIEADLIPRDGIKIVIEVEKQARECYTSYSLLEKSEFYKYDHFYIEY